MIWFKPAKNGRHIPIYSRKAYRKARYKKASDRLAPGYWNDFVGNKGKYVIFRRFITITKVGGEPNELETVSEGGCKTD